MFNRTRSKKNSTIIRREMSSWLNSHSWDLFSTYTFKEHFNFDSAKRAIERHYTRMQKTLGVRYPFFYIIEPHSHYDVSGTHIHSLIGAPVGDIKNSARKMFRDWKSRKGHGACNFQKYHEDKGAGHYLTKYLVKSEYDNSYWDIYNLRKQSNPV